MFFSRFFKKSYPQIRKNADELFESDHFADARREYQEALDMVNKGDGEAGDRSYLENKIADTGNRLAVLNIGEAEAAIRSGSQTKANEYLQLAIVLADDAGIRQKAEKLLQPSEITNQIPLGNNHSHSAHGCSSCSTSAHKNVDNTVEISHNLSSQERFQLLINTLPGDLPERYGQLGEKFASAYLFAYDDNVQEADRLYNELLDEQVNDIVFYEKGTLHFRTGDLKGCEILFKHSLQVNQENPLTHLSLAQLYADSGRYNDAFEVLDSMLQKGILPEQTLVMRGDLFASQGLYENAIDVFTPALENPILKKTAAERLVQILNIQGRDQEAAFLAKTYLKGCC